jgi:hypothetical protein
MLPGIADAFGDRAGSADVSALSTVEHNDHWRTLAAIEIDQVEYGAIDRSSITDRINRRLVSSVGPWWILYRNGA